MKLVNEPVVLSPGNFSLRSKVTSCTGSAAVYPQDFVVAEKNFSDDSNQLWTKSPFRVYKQDASKRDAIQSCLQKQMVLATILSETDNKDVQGQAKHLRCSKVLLGLQRISG